MQKWKSLKSKWVSLGIIVLSATKLLLGTDVWGGGGCTVRTYHEGFFWQARKNYDLNKGNLFSSDEDCINETHYPYFWRVLDFFKICTMLYYF